MVILAEDSNSKMGRKWIPNDINAISPNGKLAEDMMLRQDLHLFYGSEK